jgi:transposase
MLKSRNGTKGREAERPAGSSSGDAGQRAAGSEKPNPELIERARRRQFTAEYKQRVLEEADACKEPGEVGALLRREGLYSSHLTTWRKQRDEGALAALSRRRGRKQAHPLEAENRALRRRVERAEAELAKARKVIEVQGNVSALLGELLEPRSAESDESSDS